MKGPPSGGSFRPRVCGLLSAGLGKGLGRAWVICFKGGIKRKDSELRLGHVVSENSFFFFFSFFFTFFSSFFFTVVSLFICLLLSVCNSCFYFLFFSFLLFHLLWGVLLGCSLSPTCLPCHQCWATDDVYAPGLGTSWTYVTWTHAHTHTRTRMQSNSVWETGRETFLGRRDGWDEGRTG